MAAMGEHPGGFDYGERRDDGQYERHPTKDEGEFVQPVRDAYVHEDGECADAITVMGAALAESFARDPHQYHKTFCARCGDYYDLGEFVWKDTDIRLDSPVPQVEENQDGDGIEPEP